MNNQEKARHHVAEAEHRLTGARQNPVKAQAHASLALYYQGESDPPQKFERLGKATAPKPAHREPVRAILARCVGERLTPSLLAQVRMEISNAGYDGEVVAFPDCGRLEYRPLGSYVGVYL